MNARTDRSPNRRLLQDWPFWLLLVLTVAITAWVYPKLPAELPTHFGLSGEPNRYSPTSQAVYQLPLVAVGTYLLMLFLPQIDPKRANYGRFPGFYRLLRWGLPAWMLVMHLATVLSAAGFPIPANLVIRLGVGLLFIALGLGLGKVEPNYFIGIRTPWTLASEAVWVQTHRWAGPIFIGGGLLMLVGGWLPGKTGLLLSGVALAGVIILPVLYSYLLFRKLQG